MITKKQLKISLIATVVLSFIFMVLTGFILEGRIVESTGCEPRPYPDCPSSVTYGFGWPLEYREVVNMSGLFLHSKTDYNYLNGALDFTFYFIILFVLFSAFYILRKRGKVNK